MKSENMMKYGKLLREDGGITYGQDFRSVYFQNRKWA